LELHGLLCGIGKKGDCHGNAAMEGFFRALKVEQVNGCRYQAREEAKWCAVAETTLTGA
jgi:transposase InsO family protein